MVMAGLAISEQGHQTAWYSIFSLAPALRRMKSYSFNPFKWLLIGLIRGYQLFISPLLGRSCRFYPTCSSYCLQAIESFGVLSGIWFCVRRIGRCHPFHPGGYDPLPNGTDKQERPHGH
jgi:uncharacterized protein